MFSVSQLLFDFKRRARQHLVLCHPLFVRSFVTSTPNETSDLRIATNSFQPAHGTRCHSSLRAAPEGAHSRGTKRRHLSTYMPSGSHGLCRPVQHAATPAGTAATVQRGPELRARALLLLTLRGRATNRRAPVLLVLSLRGRANRRGTSEQLLPLASPPPRRPPATTPHRPWGRLQLRLACTGASLRVELRLPGGIVLQWPVRCPRSGPVVLLPCRPRCPRLRTSAGATRSGCRLFRLFEGRWAGPLNNPCPHESNNRSPRPRPRAKLRWDGNRTR